MRASEEGKFLTSSKQEPIRGSPTGRKRHLLLGDTKKVTAIGMTMKQ